MVDIEPAFTPLSSVCRELPTPAGYYQSVPTSEGIKGLGDRTLLRMARTPRAIDCSLTSSNSLAAFIAKPPDYGGRSFAE
jgi:hypothetical protein